MKQRKITIKDVAEYASVSPATVSRVLNDYKWINPEVKERVQKAIDELNYVPDFTAKAMVRGRSQMVVVIVPVINNHFFIQLINTVIQEMKRYGYYVVVYTTESAEEECLFLGSPICQMADGILNATSLKELLPLQKVKKPMVLIDRYFEGNTSIDCVMNRNYEALYRGTEYLIQHGHRKMVFLVGAEGNGIAEERIRGFRDGLKSHGLPWRNEYVIQDCWKTEAGIRYASLLLEQPDPPTAIIAGNNTLTVGVLEAIRNHGMVLGKDISLIGFEESDEDVQAFARYGITSFRLDTSAIASSAVKLLFDRLESAGTNADACIESLELKFIERTSVIHVS